MVGDVLMSGSYDGQVQHVGADSVVDGDLVEHMYVRGQFNDGKLPAVGTCVRTMFSVSECGPTNALEQAEPVNRMPLVGPIEMGDDYDP